MKRRILGAAALCFTACICITGGTLCYLIVPQSFEQAAALEFHLDEALPVQDEAPPTVHTAHEPEILTQQTALAASLQAHGIVIDRPIDWTREQVIHFAGTASVDAQALHYGAYVLQSDGALREVLADYAVPETTGGFYAEIPSFHVALNAPTKLQCLGSGTMAREVGCSALVRYGWQLVRLRSTYYIRLPISWNTLYHI